VFVAETSVYYNAVLLKTTYRIRFADRAFLCAGPSVSNSLSSYVVDTSSMAVFSARCVR